MRYPQSNDPEVQRIHRLRSMAGAVVLFGLAAGLTTIAAVTPPAPQHVSVNCVDVQPAPTMYDVPQGIEGCAPPPLPGEAKAPASPIHAITPKAVEHLTADDPPIATF